MVKYNNKNIDYLGEQNPLYDEYSIIKYIETPSNI